uniref:Uncharacterized protein n=1 Tax=viral metagenome TaxID=1070528 RepID=A0A6C0H797_9ZZZZ
MFKYKNYYTFKYLFYSIIIIMKHTKIIKLIIDYIYSNDNYRKYLTITIKNII